MECEDFASSLAEKIKRLSREGHGRDRVSLNYRSFMFGKLPPPACPGLCYYGTAIGYRYRLQPAEIIFWLVVWNLNFIFPFSWEWKIIPTDFLHIFQRGRWLNHQPVFEENKL